MGDFGDIQEKSGSHVKYTKLPGSCVVVSART